MFQPLYIQLIYIIRYFFLRISVSFYYGAFHLTHSEADSCSQGFFMLSFARSPSKMKILFPHNSFIFICVILKFPVANVILRSLLGEKKKKRHFTIVVTITINIPNYQCLEHKHSGCTGFQPPFRQFHLQLIVSNPCKIYPIW